MRSWPPSMPPLQASSPIRATGGHSSRESCGLTTVRSSVICFADAQRFVSATVSVWARRPSYRARRWSDVEYITKLSSTPTLPPDPTPLHPHLRPIVPRSCAHCWPCRSQSGTRLKKTDTRVGTDASAPPALLAPAPSRSMPLLAPAPSADARVGAADARAADRRERCPSPKRRCRAHCRTLRRRCRRAPPRAWRHFRARRIGCRSRRRWRRAPSRRRCRRPSRRGRPTPRRSRRFRLADAEQRAHAFARAEIRLGDGVRGEDCTPESPQTGSTRAVAEGHVEEVADRFAREGRLELRRAQLGDADERTHRRVDADGKLRGGGGVQPREAPPTPPRAPRSSRRGQRRGSRRRERRGS